MSAKSASVSRDPSGLIRLRWIPVTVHLTLANRLKEGAQVQHANIKCTVIAVAENANAKFVIEQVAKHQKLMRFCAPRRSGLAGAPVGGKPSRFSITRAIRGTPAEFRNFGSTPPSEVNAEDSGDNRSARIYD